MNTYRITITSARGPEQDTVFSQFDVDARQPLTAILHTLNGELLTQFEYDQITITTQLYARDIFPPHEQKIRQVGA